MVDSVSGSVTRLQSFPVVSPDGQRFMTASLDIQGGPSANELQIWKVAPGGHELEWRMRPGLDLNHPNPAVTAWGPIKPRWRDPATVSISAYANMFFNPQQRDGGGTREYQVAPGELIFQLIEGKWLFRGYDP